MKVLCLLLRVSLCIATASAAAAKSETNQSYHDVCEWSCAIKSYATVAEGFLQLVDEEKERFVNLTINAHTESEAILCKNSSVYNSSEFHPSWAADEREPYLYLPSDLVGFSISTSPFHYKERMTITLSCIGTVPENAPPALTNTSRLERAVTRSLMQDLMRERGVLCFPRESQDQFPTVYWCCRFDGAAITCDQVQSTIARLVRTLHDLWQYVLYIGAAYLPALLCLFPCLPKKSKEGNRPCIALDDPSPAALRSLLVKFLVPQLQKDTKIIVRLWLFLFKAGVSFLIMVPVFYAQGWNLDTLLKICGVVLYSLHGLQVFTEAFGSASAIKKCILCEKPHLDTLEAVKAHVRDQIWISTKNWREYIVENYASLVCYCPEGASPCQKIGWEVLGIFTFLFLLPFVLLGCAVIFSLTFLIYSPTVSITIFDMSCAYEHFTNAKGNTSKAFSLLAFVPVLGRFGFLVWIIFASRTWGMLLSYGIMVVIDRADTVLTLVAFWALVLFYLHECFSSFSEKYQLLKIKLFLAIIEHEGANTKCGESSRVETTTGRETTPNTTGRESLLVHTKLTGNEAIPEDLYEKACKELDMRMMKTFWVAFVKMACLIIFVLSVYYAIMIFGARTGVTPLTKMVAFFLAGLFPQMLPMLSSGQQTLQEHYMEMKVKKIVRAEYSTEKPATTDRESVAVKTEDIVLHNTSSTVLKWKSKLVKPSDFPTEGGAWSSTEAIALSWASWYCIHFMRTACENIVSDYPTDYPYCCKL